MRHMDRHMLRRYWALHTNDNNFYAVNPSELVAEFLLMSKGKLHPCISLLDIHMICTLSYFYRCHCTRLPKEVVTKPLWKELRRPRPGLCRGTSRVYSDHLIFHDQY